MRRGSVTVCMCSMCSQGWAGGSKRLSPRLLRLKVPEMAPIGVVFRETQIKRKTGRTLNACWQRKEKRARRAGLCDPIRHRHAQLTERRH